MRGMVPHPAAGLSVPQSRAIVTAAMTTTPIARRAFLGAGLVLLLRGPALAGTAAIVYKDPT